MKHRSIVAVLAAGALVLAACGDDDDSSSGATTTVAAATTVAPVDTTEAPAETTEAPVETTEAPAETTEAPVETTEAPAETTEAPAETTEAPVETTEAPVETTEAPVETTEAPVETTEAPVETTEAPVETTEAPVETTEAPVETTEAPVETTEAPVETTEAPVETTEAPVETTEAPVETTEAPVETTEAPAETTVPDDGGITFPVTPGEDWPDKIIFTFTPSQESANIDSAQPVADELEARLGIEVEPIIAADFEGVITAIGAGQADVGAGLGPVLALRAVDEANAELILQVVRAGESAYVTQWFTNDPDTYCEDEPVEIDGLLFCNGVSNALSPSEGPFGGGTLGNAAGANVAFVNENSASGYLVPALELVGAGVDPISGISPIFAGSHTNTVLAVANGQADIGVSFNDARTQLVETNPEVAETVVVFAWSFPIPNDAFAVSADLPEDLRAAIAAAFLDIASTDEGAAILYDTYEIDGFVPANVEVYDMIADLLQQLAELSEA